MEIAIGELNPLRAGSHLQRSFGPTQFRRAWNKAELADSTGAPLRIDRLVEFDDEVWVLDFKNSGSDTQRLHDCRRQVLGCCRVAAHPVSPFSG